jgi:hypothetical protein
VSTNQLFRFDSDSDKTDANRFPDSDFGPKVQESTIGDLKKALLYSNTDF